MPRRISRDVIDRTGIVRTASACRLHLPLAALLLVACVNPAVDVASAPDGSVAAMVVSPRDVRGLYVSDVFRAATVEAERARLVSLVVAHGFTAVTLYNLSPFFPAGADVASLVSLLRQLRRLGVRSVALPVGSEGQARRLEAWLQRHPEVSVDALVTEHEYWNDCRDRRPEALGSDRLRPCFMPFQSLVEALRGVAMRLRAHGRDLRVGAYLGYPTRGEVAWLASRLEFAWLDQPGVSPVVVSRAVGVRAKYRLDRFRWFAEAGVSVWPIFYTRGEVPMQPWLDRRGVDVTEAAYFEALSQDVVLGPLAGAIEGVQYFADDGFSAP